MRPLFPGPLSNPLGPSPTSREPAKGPHTSSGQDQKLVMASRKRTQPGQRQLSMTTSRASPFLPVSASQLRGGSSGETKRMRDDRPAIYTSTQHINKHTHTPNSG